MKSESKRGWLIILENAGLLSEWYASAGSLWLANWLSGGIIASFIMYQIDPKKVRSKDRDLQSLHLCKKVRCMYLCVLDDRCRYLLISKASSFKLQARWEVRNNLNGPIASIHTVFCMRAWWLQKTLSLTQVWPASPLPLDKLKVSALLHFAPRTQASWLLRVIDIDHRSSITHPSGAS